jgi:hypothetical protein
MPPQGTVTRCVDVRHSPVHGHGVFALKPLPAGSVIGLYTDLASTPAAPILWAVAGCCVAVLAGSALCCWVA